MASHWDRAGFDDVDWEARYQAGDTPWDKGEAHPGLLWWLSRQSLRGRILVPGCGLGHDVRALADHGADVTGADLSATAIQIAEEFPKARNEAYSLADFLQPPSEWEAQFDALFEHTCFCAIPPTLRTQYVAASARLLKPDGLLLAIFFLDPGKPEGPPHGCTPAELDALFSAHFSVLHEESAFPTFTERTGRELIRLLQKKSG